MIHNYIEKTKPVKGTNWEQKFQKPQNENICLTNLNVDNNGNFPILGFWGCMENWSEDWTNRNLCAEHMFVVLWIAKEKNEKKVGA